MYAQAHNVINKFGGARRLATAINRDPTAVYKWTYPAKRGGTDGLIPSSALPLIMEAAELLDVKLTANDLNPTTKLAK
jgi:hypothetical protein